MADIRIVMGKRVYPEERVALRLMGCKAGTKSWRDAAQAFTDYVAELRRLIRPKAAFSLTDDKKHIYALLTLGRAVSLQLDRLMQGNDMAEAMLLSAMADSCLFAFEREIVSSLQAFCQEKSIGIAARHEAGSDVPLDVQQTAWELLRAKQTLGLELTKSLMLVPEKSLCLVYDVSDDPAVFHAVHDCSRCPSTTCPLRQVAAPGTYTVEAGENVLASLKRQDAQILALCGGTGRCGRCAVRVVAGALDVTAEDADYFTREQLGDGWRLACKATAIERVTVSVPKAADTKLRGLGLGGEKEENTPVPDEAVGLAIDLGSTTVACALVGLTSHAVLASAASANEQRRYGADVVSRIRAACGGEGRELQRLALGSIAACIRALAKKTAFPPISYVTIAGNTTMEHLLMGWSCSGLGSWPFRPISLGGQTMPLLTVSHHALLASDSKMTLLPGCSTYVGADIAAGLIATGVDTSDTLTLFLDLGTNGEMTLGNKNRLLIASTAAGPALEGGQLTCGMSSIDGAICGVTIREGQPQVRTIGSVPPKGICGTGAIEGLAALLEAGLVDRHGKLAEPWFRGGFPLAYTAQGEAIALTQADIRGIQMAKGAIRAGIEVLLAAWGARAEDIGRVLIAGGFGYYLDVTKAAAIGLIPAGCAAKASAVGNTSLAGAAQALWDEEVLPRMQKLCSRAEEIVLGNSDRFQDLYIQYIDL